MSDQVARIPKGSADYPATLEKLLGDRAPRYLGTGQCQDSST